MSYIQIEIGGKLRGLKFNLGALILMQEKSNPDTTAYTGYALIYSGLKTNAYVKEVEFVDEVEESGKKKEIPITFEMVCDWVDELDQSVIVAVMDCFNKTELYKKNLPEVKEDEGDKKKLETPTESTASGSVADG